MWVKKEGEQHMREREKEGKICGGREHAYKSLKVMWWPFGKLEKEKI